MRSMDAPRTRLAIRIRERRQALGLTRTDAARLAGMARNTWSTAEDGAREIQDKLYGGIETAMVWEPGSVARVLAGGEPVELVRPANGALPPDFDLDDELERIERLDIPPRRKLRLARTLIRLYEQDQADRERAPQAGREVESA